MAGGPPISVPTITIAGNFDRPAANGTAYRTTFTGPYEHRVFEGIGHNVPQEVPEAFAQAIADVDQL